MPNRKHLKQQVCAAIDSSRDPIAALGEAKMDAPELGFKEVRTAQRVKEVFQEAAMPFQDELAITGVKGV